MKKRILILSVFIALYTHAQDDAHAQDDILAIVLMVKNEEAVIVKTLQPYLDAGINSFLVFDTGSEDATIANAENFFKANHVKHWFIVQEPWIDFCTSRNHALEAAEDCFPDTPFYLMPDAEWYMHNVKGLLDFCEERLYDTSPCYLVRIMNSSIDFTATRLIRAKSNARFLDDVHEAIPIPNNQALSVKVPGDVFFELSASRQGVEKSRKRWERDLVLLLKRHQADPAAPRPTFYLAQTYDCLGDAYNAYKYYKIRSEQEGWHEENYETFYRLGLLTEKLSETDSAYTWSMAFDYYSIAHNMLPHRAEPLVRIADHYWPDCSAPLNVALCYLFAKRACELPYPEHDLLFIDPYTYNLKRYELLSKSAWHVGDFESGEMATRNALIILSRRPSSSRAASWCSIPKTW